ncbi:MAG: TonB-dependent receptor [Syntrophothermus sp.]
MTEKIRLIIMLILSLSGLTGAAENLASGVIKGKVINQNTREVLTGANVRLSGTQLGAAADINGEFTINNIPAGSYSLECTFMGFETRVITDIQVRPERITFITAELKEQLIKLNDVTVKAGYFRNDDINPMGTTSFNNQEIRRSPGSAGDVSRILLVMPSTAKVADNSNDLAVRGGSPSENAFYIDNIPVPNINHFPTEGGTGGPIGMLNIDFIENVSFLTSGFSSSYGDRLSSVVDVTFREGNRDKTEFQIDMNMSGFGGVAEGPLPGRSGSWMLSARKSYLDLLVGAIGTGTAPRYGDIQGKAVFDLSKNHKLSFLQVFGNSTIDFSRETSIDNGSSSYGLNKNYQNTTGLNWLALWSSSFYSNTSLSFSRVKVEADFRNTFTQLQQVNVKNREETFVLRNVNFMQMNKSSRVEFGTELRYEPGYFDQFTASDTSRLGQINPARYVKEDVSAFKAGLFMNYIFMPFEKLTATIGLRGDYYDLNKTTPFSPRLAVSYQVNERLKINAAAGIFYQQLPIVVLALNSQIRETENLKAVHYGAGFEYMLTEDTKLTFEAYDKEYDRLPLDAADPSLSIIDNGQSFVRFRKYDDVHSTGKAYTRGLELMVQKKLARDIYGLVSGSYFRSRYQDYSGLWRDRVYDNQYIFSAIGGYKPNEEWEFSLRWTYAGGCPFTPFNENLSRLMNTAIIDQSKINTVRYPDYHTLNIGIEKKFFFNSQSLDLYLNIMNAYNRKNVAQYSWNSIENKQATVYQWSIMPVLGVEYEL